MPPQRTLPGHNAQPAVQTESHGPRQFTRPFDLERAHAAFPSDAEQQFTAFLNQSAGRRRKNRSAIQDGKGWFTDSNRLCSTPAQQSQRHWWKNAFRYDVATDTLLAKPTSKYALERKVVPEEDFYETVLYEHDINGPRNHETTARSLMEHYYGPTRQEALWLLKKCQSCAKKGAESYPSPPSKQADEPSALQQISHGPVILPGIPTFETLAAKRRWQLCHMAAAFRYFSRHGYVEGMSGHISVRDPEHENAFWMNPLGKHFGLLRASDMILVDGATGSILSQDKSRPINAAGFLIHKAVHDARPDVHAVCHAHTVYGRAYSAFAKPLEMLTQDVCNFYNAHSVYANYGGIVFGAEEGRRIAAALGNGKGCILMNHGLLTVGQTVDEAAFMFGLMERSCQIQLLADAAANHGKPKRLIRDQEAAYNFKNASDPDALYAEFQGDYEYEEAMCNGDFKN